MNSMPRRYDVKRAEQLSADERDSWREILRARPTLWSPYFKIEFIEQMQAVSDRVRIAVVREAGAPIAFLPLQRVVMGLAQPVGGPLCDTHGLIAAESCRIDFDSLLESAGVSFFTFHGVPADQAAFVPCARAHYDCHMADLSAGYEAWHDAQSVVGGTKRSFKSMLRKVRNMERDLGPVRFELNDKSDAAFEKLLRWKRAQYHRTRSFDVFSLRWTVELLSRLRSLRGRPLQGQLSSLYAGDTLVAVHFGMRGEATANYWFPAYDPSYGKYSPGQIIMDLMYRAWANEGVQRVDLGGGETQFKLQFGGMRLRMIEGLAHRPSFASETYQAVASLARRVTKCPNKYIAELPHRIAKRIHHRVLIKLV